MRTVEPAAKPQDEDRRLTGLRMVGLLDTEAEEQFDRLTRLARRILGVPIALFSLVDADRQWFKSNQGLDVAETSRDSSFCAHAIVGDADVFVVEDATADRRFSDNPLVTGDPGIRFYAGSPVCAPDGSKLGTLCVIDRVPRELPEEDAQVLRDLAAIVEREIEIRTLSLRDALTGLLNRRGFELLAEHVMATCRRDASWTSVIYVDVDGLKRVNDVDGHAAGDELIVRAGDLLRDVFRTTDVVARLGGDEFAVLFPGDAADAAAAVTRLASRAEASGISLSIGVATSPAADLDLPTLVTRADEAMYVAKRNRSARD